MYPVDRTAEEAFARLMDSIGPEADDMTRNRVATLVQCLMAPTKTRLSLDRSAGAAWRWPILEAVVVKVVGLVLLGVIAGALLWTAAEQHYRGCVEARAADAVGSGRATDSLLVERRAVTVVEHGPRPGAPSQPPIAVARPAAIVLRTSVACAMSG